MVGQGLDEDVSRLELFSNDLNAMNECDTLLIILDGRTIDEGACFELGYMYGQGKRCFGYKTDSRSYIRGRNNLMIDGGLERIVSSLDELGNFVDEIIQADRGYVPPGD